jgi:2'-hydroxyisoflavone reductase
MDDGHMTHLLILGGTRFLGRHIAQAALDAGHRVTLFNRGRTAADLFPQAEHLLGDRDGDHRALAGRRFDAVIDCCGYKPAQVQGALQALGADAPHYVFISSISAHARFPVGEGFDEDAPLLQGEQGYGEEKARSEEALLALTHGRCTIVRPGLIVGPFDPTGRFTYWPARIARGGPVLAPGRPERPVQWIDARDLAAWCVQLAVHPVSGVFNAVGPLVAMRDLLVACVETSASNASLHWLDDAALQAAEVAPWTGLPLWLPENDPAFGGMLLGRNQRAVAAGLTCRPVQETVADTLAWLRSDAGAVVAPADALSAQREAELLQPQPTG